MLFLQAAVSVLRETWAYRDLLRNLVVRDLKVRYKRSVLGFAWSFLNPLFMVLIFTVVFTVIAKAQNVPNYPLFALCGLLAWNFLAGSISGAARSIVGNAHLIDKVYFPRELLPISVVLSNLINFVLSLVVFFALLLLFRVPLSWWIVTLPVLIAVQFVLVVGLALIVAALNVFYRDVEHVLDVGLLAWFFLTPIFWELELLPNKITLPWSDFGIDVWLLEYRLNPMASLVTDYRYVLLYDYGIIRHTVVPLAIGLVCLVVGWYFFRRNAHRFAEEI
ncbi:MAG: ABC transporter [Dehalococcoidia bacterium]|nr:ABC transporter [Dehalococcoidia bacterium]